MWSCSALLKPARLAVGDTVAVLSPSWGGPSIFPHIYESGLEALRDLGLQVREYPSARADNDYLFRNPRARAKDINDAFANSEVKAIFASIGGDDSIRILPFLNPVIIKKNPKILMGYSDTTTLLTYINQMGLVTFNGPSVMAGFSQVRSLPESFGEHIQAMFFSPRENYEYASYDVYCDGYPDWRNPENIGKTNELKRDDGWNFLQGSGVESGELYGGSIEVLEILNGTDFWAKKDFWKGKILFLETSEDKPPVQRVRRMLRNYGMQGIFDQVLAVLFGRPRDYTDEAKAEFDRMVLEVIKGEFGNGNIPVVSNMDFGHTDPQFILPLGVRAEIDCDVRAFKLLESPVQ
jgi:muramoyltetrapeptide carboxypeptidase LdcA involved in peptidoglycan recycling